MRKQAWNFAASIVVVLGVVVGIPAAAQIDNPASGSSERQALRNCAVGLAPLGCSGVWSAAGYCDGIGDNC
jgi:hypothetical protein